MDCTVHEELDSVGALAELGLDSASLTQAISEGELARASCTENDPRIFPGQFAWARTVRALRERLIPQGWRPVEELNQPLIVSPDGRIAITVFSGDEGTGQAGSSPQPRNPKGPVTLAAVQKNSRQLAFNFAAENVSGSDATGSAPRLTWVLLVFRADDEVRCELSLPGAIAEARGVVSWVRRILLAPVPLDGEREAALPETEPAVTVEVVRKAQ